MLLAWAVGDVLYQRVGTTANVDLVERSRNLAGGFVALGRTERKPGFLLLSALDESSLAVSATQVSNWATGTHATVEITTSQGLWRRRLRCPLAIVVDDVGGVVAEEVDWSAAELDQLRAAMDCTTPGATRCGAPFADLHEAFSKWSAHRVPEAVLPFLDLYGRPGHGRPDERGS